VRDSLKKSAADSPASGFDRYAKGSIVVCTACAKPIFKLERGIALGDKAGQMASAFKPLSLVDVDALAGRTDIDQGVRAAMSSMSLDKRVEFVNKLREVRSGDPMICPVCGDCFVQVLSVEAHEVLDKSYTLELLTIPPDGRPAPLRGKYIGYGPGKSWIH
jgi:hypothetical protein